MNTKTKTGFVPELARQLKISVAATLVLTAFVSALYPVVVWGLAQVFFPHKANGSLIDRGGNPTTNDSDAVGSSLIGQNFADAKYFRPRPSAAGGGYDPTASGGTNLGPTSAKLLTGAVKKDDKGKEVVDFDGVQLRIVHYCIENGLAFESSAPIKDYQDAQGNLDDVKLIKAFNDDKAALTITPKNTIPADAVTASASGLDPHISLANARIQVPRVAAARKLSEDVVTRMVEESTDGPGLGILGDPAVNVLRVNLALDRSK